MRIYIDKYGNIDTELFLMLMKKVNNIDLVHNALINNGGFVRYIEIDDIYSDCVKDDFNDDFTFNADKYLARKEKEKRIRYEDYIIEKIREVYSINQELSILRQQTSKPSEFDEYNLYVEKCKAEAKNKFQTI